MLATVDPKKKKKKKHKTKETENSIRELLPSAHIVTISYCGLKSQLWGWQKVMKAQKKNLLVVLNLETWGFCVPSNCLSSTVDTRRFQRS